MIPWIQSLIHISKSMPSRLPSSAFWCSFLLPSLIWLSRYIHISSARLLLPYGVEVTDVEVPCLFTLGNYELMRAPSISNLSQNTFPGSPFPVKCTGKRGPFTRKGTPGHFQGSFAPNLSNFLQSWALSNSISMFGPMAALLSNLRWALISPKSRYVFASPTHLGLLHQVSRSRPPRTSQILTVYQSMIKYSVLSSTKHHCKNPLAYRSVEWACHCQIVVGRSSLADPVLYRPSARISRPGMIMEWPKHH